MLKYFLSTFCILLAFALFEFAVLSNMVFLPAVPDFLLICVIYYALRHGKSTGETTGFISGIMLDFLSGCPFGFNSLLRTVIGYGTGYLSRIFSTEGFLVPSVMTFAVTFFKAFLIFLISFFYPAIVNTYRIFSVPFAFELVMNAILAPLVFKFLGYFDSLFPAGEKMNK